MATIDAQRSLTTRSLDVVGAVSTASSRLSLSGISRAAGLSLTTTHRIVGDLVAWGALERGADGRYQIGLRLWEAASQAPRGTQLRESALPIMEDLYESTHENVQLAVREGHEVVYVERLKGRGAVRVLTRVGGRFALHATGVGLVLLAHAPAEVQNEVLSAPLRGWTPHTITDPARLRTALAEIRHTGVVVSDRAVTEDAVSVACPVYGAHDTVIAGLSVVMHTEAELTPAAVTPAVRAAARALSRVLGSRQGRSRAVRR